MFQCRSVLYNLCCVEKLMIIIVHLIGPFLLERPRELVLVISDVRLAFASSWIFLINLRIHFIHHHCSIWDILVARRFSLALLDCTFLELLFVNFETVFAVDFRYSLDERGRALDGEGSHVNFDFLQAVWVDLQMLRKVLDDDGVLQRLLSSAIFLKDVDLNFHSGKH